MQKILYAMYLCHFTKARRTPIDDHISDVARSSRRASCFSQLSIGFIGTQILSPNYTGADN